MTDRKNFSASRLTREDTHGGNVSLLSRCPRTCALPHEWATVIALAEMDPPQAAHVTNRRRAGPGHPPGVANRAHTGCRPAAQNDGGEIGSYAL